MANFDGYSVESYQARLTGTFDVDIQDGEKQLRYGNRVVLMVVGTVGPATMKEDKLGDMRRVNAIAVDGIKFATAEEQSDLFAEMGVTHQLTIPVPAVPREILTPTAPDDGAQMAVPDHILTPDGYVEPEELEPPVTEDVRPSERPVDKPYDDDEDSLEAEVFVDGESQGIARIKPPSNKHLARFLSEVP